MNTKRIKKQNTSQYSNKKDAKKVSKFGWNSKIKLKFGTSHIDIQLDKCKSTFVIQKIIIKR
jgi:hypothetical protein